MSINASTILPSTLTANKFDGSVGGIEGWASGAALPPETAQFSFPYCDQVPERLDVEAMKSAGTVTGSGGATSGQSASGRERSMERRSGEDRWGETLAGKETMSMCRRDEEYWRQK